MKIKRTELIEKINEIEAREVADYNDRLAKHRARRAVEEGAWNAGSSRSELKVFSERLTRALRRKAPICLADVFETSRGDGRDYYHLRRYLVELFMEPDREVPKPRLEYLITVREFLEMITDDVITSSALKAHGYGNLAMVLQRHGTTALSGGDW